MFFMTDGDLIVPWWGTAGWIFCLNSLQLAILLPQLLKPGFDSSQSGTCLWTFIEKCRRELPRATKYQYVLFGSATGFPTLQNPHLTKPHFDKSHFKHPLQMWDWTGLHGAKHNLPQHHVLRPAQYVIKTQKLMDEPLMENEVALLQLMPQRFRPGTQSSVEGSGACQPKLREVGISGLFERSQ